MDNPTRPIDDVGLYERDFYAWCLEQARRLRARAGSGADIDWENVAEEIESLGRSDKRAIGSHLRVLLTHLLKCQYQPKLRTRSWEKSIENARDEIADLIKESPSLQGLLGEKTIEAYPRAVRDAADETGLDKATFPARCPYSQEQLLSHGFLPG